jgi:glycosyltransferase involved in cell wall biosynthesis
MTKISFQVTYAPILGNESRIMKSCNSIIKLGLVDEVVIIGFCNENLKRREKLSQNINVIRIPLWIRMYTFKKSMWSKVVAGISILQYFIGIIYYALKTKPNYISCHNAQTLPACVLAKFLSGAILIYEPHELEAERAGLGKIGQSIVKVIERKFIRFCYKVITVCEPISDYYLAEYALPKNKVLTIRNVPINPFLGKNFPRTNFFREEFDISDESIIFIYQGIINDLRGLKNYLETFSQLDDRYHLVMMGFGDGVEKVIDYSKRFKNIHYKAAVPVDEIIKYTSSADIGLFILPGVLPMSYKFALPNKFYEYIIAGLYICVSENLEYLSEIVKNHELGSIISPSEKGLLQWINNSSFLKQNLIPNDESLSVRKRFGWQNEEEFFLQVYS